MSKIRKPFLSLLLCFIMVFSLLQVFGSPASGEELVPDEALAAADGEEASSPVNTTGPEEVNVTGPEEEVSDVEPSVSEEVLGDETPDSGAEVSEEEPVPDPFKISFFYNDTLLEERLVEPGSALGSLPAVPGSGVDDQFFTGWVCDGKPVTEETAAEGDMTVTAVYTRMPASDGKKTAETDQVKVTYSYEAGVFPEGVSPEVKVISQKEALALLKKGLKPSEKAVDAYGVDIRFVLKAGDEPVSVQPRGKSDVSVEISFKDRTLEGDTFVVMHEDGVTGEVSSVEEAAGTAEGMTFKAGAFSVYLAGSITKAAALNGAGGRATFDAGGTVRNKWTSLAGNRDNVTAIKQYSGFSVPEGVTTQIVSASNSEVPIYSWFDNGTIYYWSEDTRPYTNPNASYMFNGFTKATYIDAAPFDTSKTTDMEAMFANCTSLKTLDVSGFDTSNVRCMYCMFIYCGALETLDVSHLNTRNATSTSDEGYGSICGMFLGCSSVTELDLSSFDMTRMISYPYNVQNMFPGCTNLKKLILGPNVRFNGYTALSGSWTHEEDGLTLSASALCSQYNAANAFSYSGTWLRNMPEGHYYHTDGSLGELNLWEVHTPDDRFKGYCLNLNRFGVGEDLDRVEANDDSAIEALLCTEAEGSTHGCAPLGATMREALITLVYYGWPNDAAGIQERYGLTDQEYLDITQNAMWDFTDRYDEPAGPTHYEGKYLQAYNELVAQRFANIEGEYILFLYKSWDGTKQNLLSIMGVDDQKYGGVSVRKQTENGSENLAGAEFTVYNAAGEAVGTMTTSANGVAYICRTDHSAGLPLGQYTVKETAPPAGYKLSDIVYHFEITEANEIVTIGWRPDPLTPDGAIEEEMIYFDKHDDEYVGGGLGIVKESDTGKKLVGAEFTIYDQAGNEVTTLITNNSGLASTGKQDLPLGTYTVKETRAPAGHHINEEVRTVEIAENFQFLTLTFENKEKKGTVRLEAKKILESETQTLREGQFTFQLLDAKDNVIQTAQNDADGNVFFNPITYTPDDLGYKNYHIVEVIGSDAGIRYDRHREDVTVTIYDTEEDDLVCTAVYDSDGAVFTNTDGGVSYDVEILKKKTNTDVVVEGAVLEIRDLANRLIGSWVSSGEAYTVKLEPGVYVLREMTAPRGYFEISTVRFEVLSDGSLSGTGPVQAEGHTLTVYDTSIPSTEFKIRKTDADTGEVLEGASFELKGTGASSYSASAATDSAGEAAFAGLETGTYTLTETDPPEGYEAEGSPWNVEVVYNRAISKTANVSASGSAAGNYSNQGFTDTVTIPGSPSSIHVVLKYQTEDNYDYLLLLDKDGNTITADKDGVAIGDPRANYRGRIWGGMESGEIRTLSFDLEGDTVSFKFVPDENAAAYGYHAVVTSDSRISITDSDGQPVEPGNGLYTVVNRKTAKSTSVQFEGTKTLEGRDLAAGEFSFTLTGSDGTEETVTNDEEGSFRFTEILYTGPGTFTYEVKEEPSDDKEVTCDDTVYEITVNVTEDDSGELQAEVSGADPKALAFVNTWVPEEAVGSLKISKTVTGNLGDKNKAFTFTIELSADGTYSYTGSKSGTIKSGGTITLKHGQSVTIEGLPENCKYKVTESDNAGYKVTSSGAVGVIAKNVTAAAAFTNDRSKPGVTPTPTPTVRPGGRTTPTGGRSARTGDGSPLMASLLGLILSGTVIAAVLFTRRRRRSGK